MLKVAVCDDDSAEAKRVADMVRAYADFDISVYSSSGTLERDLCEGAAFDLYLLDIIMPKPDGIDLARLIRRSDSTSAVIFLTSHDGRALEAFGVRAAQYLIKPVDRETLNRELDSAISALNVRNAKTFLLKASDGTQAVPFHRIAYCELKGRALCCVTLDGARLKSVTLRQPFDEVVAPLLSDGRFIRPHMSFVVNMDFVKSVHARSVLMKSGAIIPITHGAVGDVKEKYIRYFFKGKT